MIEVASKEKQLSNLEREFEKHKTASEQAEENVKIHWIEMGKILCKIRDGKLHPQKRFEQYCLQRWGYKRSNAFKLCRSFETHKQLEDSKKSTNSEIVDSLPKDGKMSVSQADELTKVEPAKRARVLKAAKKKGKLTAKSIKETAKEIKEGPKDKTGFPIPEPAMETWNRRNEVKPKLDWLYDLRQWAEDMQGSDDPLFAEIVFSGLKLDIEKVIMMLKGAVPHAVCTTCQGMAPKTCVTCKGRGMLSEYVYEHSPAIPEEMKAMREKQIATSA